MQNIPQMLQSPISATILLSSLTLSLLTTFNICSKYAFTLDFYTITAGEYYRLITGVLYLGKLSLFNIFFFINNINYISQLEKSFFAGKVKKLIGFLFYIYTFTVIFAYFLVIKEASSCFFGAITYLWVRLNPDSLFVFMGFLPLQAPVLPFLNMLIRYINKRSLLPMIIGYILGHIYWVFDVVVPKILVNNYRK
ncbi:Derlin [Spironucleus salmonicida]|uniref:Derlin n=1 Tax=Spironucleus salmonicida TaxID=348837 RepID=V6LKB9_9EUKA|nr:Derlin [Spironucleus salmonicida]|eukprot:EST45085.1 Derlin-like protein [Spironucleus salmonicida]